MCSPLDHVLAIRGGELVVRHRLVHKLPDAVRVRVGEKQIFGCQRARKTAGRGLPAVTGHGLFRQERSPLAVQMSLNVFG